MITVTVPRLEYWDEATETFGYIEPRTLTLEHSLISISKWEAKWEKRFLDDTDKTNEEAIDYIRCMCLTHNVDPKTFNFIPPEEMERINQYIASSQTATVVNHVGSKKSSIRSQAITSELIYSWMVLFKIPVEFEKWHLNRLLTLIEVVAAQKEPPKKMSRAEIMKQNRELNELRKAKYHTKG